MGFEMFVEYSNYLDSQITAEKYSLKKLQMAKDEQVLAQKQFNYVTNRFQHFNDF